MAKQNKNKSIVEYKLKNGLTRYKFQIRVGKNVITRSSFIDFETAEIAYLNLKQQGLAGKQIIKKNSITFEEVYFTWLKRYSQTVRGSTLYKTKKMFENHILPFFKDKAMQKITTQDCQLALNDWCDTLVKYKEAYRYANHIFKEAMRYDYIEVNQLEKLELPKTTIHKQTIEASRNTHNFFEEEDLKKFLLHVRSKNLLHFNFFWLLAITGMRRGEIMALTWSDVNFDTGMLSVTKAITVDEYAHQTQGPTKNGKPRFLILNNETLKYLKEWKEVQAYLLADENKEDQQIIFPNTRNKWLALPSARKWEKKYLDELNLPNDVTIHGFRHTHTTLMYNENRDINAKDMQLRLGHSHADLTMDVYNHVTDKHRDKIINALDKFNIENDENQQKN